MGKVVEYADRDEWLASRRHFIGASEVAAALGYSSRMNPLELWSLKTGLAPPELVTEENEFMYWGRALEPLVIQRFREQYPERLVTGWDQNTCVVHDTIPFLRATPDAVQIDMENHPDSGMGNLQIKTTGHFPGKEWDKGNFPLEYQIQVQAELACTGRQWGSIAVLIAGQRFVSYDFERDDDFIEAMEANLQKFWEMVLTKTMPEVDGSERTSKLLSALHPDDNGKGIVLPPEADQWDAELKQLKEQGKAIELQQRLLENRIKAAIGENTFGTLRATPGMYTYATQERAESVIKASKFRVLRRAKSERKRSD